MVSLSLFYRLDRSPVSPSVPWLIKGEVRWPSQIIIIFFPLGHLSWVMSVSVAVPRNRVLWTPSCISQLSHQGRPGCPAQGHVVSTQFPNCLLLDTEAATAAKYHLSPSDVLIIFTVRWGQKGHPCLPRAGLWWATPPPDPPKGWQSLYVAVCQFTFCLYPSLLSLLLFIDVDSNEYLTPVLSQRQLPVRPTWITNLDT